MTRGAYFMFSFVVCIVVFFQSQVSAKHHNTAMFKGEQQQQHHARHEHHAIQQHSAVGHSISCYQCNSEYDPRCGEPFDAYSLGIVNCSMRPPLEHLMNLAPTLCRKTIQKVYGKVRIIRGCGYVTDPRDDKECMKRSGTHDVHALYCSCTTSLCNGAVGVTSAVRLVLVLTSAITALAAYIRPEA